jgi:hypothetical protein
MKRPIAQRTLAGVYLMCLSGLLAGPVACSQDPTSGYSLTSPYRSGVDTVAVDIFTRGRALYRREIEFRLTEAVAKRIELDTPYKIAPKAAADTLLTGTIESVTQRTLSFDPETGSARELEMTFLISFTWTDLRTGDVLASQSGLRVSGSYMRIPPLTEEFYTGSETVINRAARRVVEQMERPW